MKFAEPRPFSDPEAVVRKLIEIANAAEAVQDARISSGSMAPFSPPAAVRPNTAPVSSARSPRDGCGLRALALEGKLHADLHWLERGWLMSIRPELQVPVATAQAIVDGVLMGHTVAAVSNIHGGEIAATYEIAFGDAQPPVVLKVYPDSLHWKMQKDVTVISLIQGRLSVPAPRILLADDSKTLLGLNFILMTKLVGSILGRLEPTLTQDQLGSAYRQIGLLLREFHRISMEAFGYIGTSGILTPHLTNQDYLSFQFDGKLREFTDRGGAVGIALRIAAHVSKRAYLLRECSHSVLCHNDLHAGNVLAEITDGDVRLSGVLDFEGALAGDPLMDVAKALYYLNAEARDAVPEGYGDTGRQHWSQTLDFYHLYFVLELWCWMAQIGNEQPLDKLAVELERCLAS